MVVTDRAPTVTTSQDVAVPCPACGTPFAWPPTARCVRCGADLAGPAARRVFDLDREAAAVRQQREEAVLALRATAVVAGPPDLPPPARPPTPVPGARGGLRPQVFLAAAGAVLLLAAAVVFIAVTWPTWPGSVQAAFIAALTVAGAVAARAAADRALPVTADALGVLTMAVAGYSLLAARREGLVGLETVDATLWWSIVAAVLAAAARPLAAWAGLRDTPRRFGAVAAVVAVGSGLSWLFETVPVEETGAVLVAAMPMLALALLLHGRWVLRDGDWCRHVARVAPAGLLAAAAVGTGLLPLDGTGLGAVTVAAGVGLPLLVRARQARPADPWTFGGLAVAVVWVAQLATFLLRDVTGWFGFERPGLVVFSVAAVAVGLAGRTWLRPGGDWRAPVLVGAGATLLPAVLWTLRTWAWRSEIVVRVLEEPLAGWPDATALRATDLALVAVAVVGTTLLVAELRTAATRTYAAVAGGVAVVVAVVAAAAAGIVPMATPLVVVGAAAVVAGAVWERDTVRWAPVAVTELAVVGAALVDVELFALATGVVAAHLLWVAARRRSQLTAGAGVAAGLAAVAATSDALGWATPTTTLLTTAVAGAVLVVAQFTPACRPWRATPTDVVVLGAVLLATATAALAGHPTTVAVQLSVLAVAAAVHAFRPGRGWAVWLSSLAVSGAVWTLLGDRGVEVVEAYTLPSAVALAAAGAWRLHTTATSSWAACWPACCMASLPTLGVLLDGPDPVRVLLLTAGAVVVALLGHWRRLAALLVAGSVVAIVTSLLQLYDWSAHLPRWVTFGALGALLIWTSATYEAQLQRARGLRLHLAGLR